MKFILLSALSLFLASSVSAQEWRLKPEIKTDTSWFRNNTPDSMPDLWLRKVPEIKYYNQGGDLWVQGDSDGRSLFPGSSRYYAKRPDLDPSNGRNFIKTPDKSVKNYLIIKDPLTQKVTR